MLITSANLLFSRGHVKQYFGVDLMTRGGSYFACMTDVNELEDAVATLGGTLRGGSRNARRAAAVVMGQRGGPARAAALTPERRAEIARVAARARWARAK